MVAKQDEWAATDLPRAMGNPARRALATAGIARLEEAATWREADLLRLHGMGPRGLRILGEALAARGLLFAREPE